MAIISTTASDFSLISTYTCATTRLIGVNSAGQQVDQVSSSSTSTPTRPSATLTFSYDAVDLNNVNTVVLQMKSSSTPYGGTVRVNGEAVYDIQRVYTAYFDASSIASTSATFTIDFQSYNPHHIHYNDADYQETVGGGTNHALIRYTKQHTAEVLFSEITLKIYTGEDGISTSAACQMVIGVDNIAKKVSEMYVGIGGKARRISEVWIGVGGVAKRIFPALTVGDLQPGDIIQLDEAGDGTLVDWIVMHQDYYGEKQTVLMRKNCIDYSSYLYYEGYAISGSNPYFNGEMDNYLSNSWLLSRGYLTFQNLLLDTSITVRSWSYSNDTTDTRKVWLPSAINISPSGSTNSYDDPKGTFDYFSAHDANADRIAYTDNGTAVRWWTRTATPGTHPYCRVITASGDFSNWQYYYNGYPRPVINIDANNALEKVEEGIYKIIISKKQETTITLLTDSDDVILTDENGAILQL